MIYLLKAPSFHSKSSWFINNLGALEQMLWLMWCWRVCWCWCWWWCWRLCWWCWWSAITAWLTPVSRAAAETSRHIDTPTPRQYDTTPDRHITQNRNTTPLWHHATPTHHPTPVQHASTTPRHIDITRRTDTTRKSDTTPLRHHAITTRRQY